MKPLLKQLLEMLEGAESISSQQLVEMKKIIQNIDKELAYVEFKLERTEKVKRTTSILLEETIEELEQKRLAVEKLAFISSRQASQERIRAEIASMRRAEDLKEISPLIWEELQNMKVPFIRCGVFIIDEEAQLLQIFLNTPQKESIAVLHIPYEGIGLTEKVYSAWKRQEVYKENWKESDFNNWVKTLANKGYIESKEHYGAGVSPVNLELHFIPFKQGMLYIGNTEHLSEENLELGRSLADTFSVAYDRYEDFTKLEIAKKNVEITLKTLRNTQDQLVQQEKLASLGQLTAGIAHEIQNPLNFVNNFSEVSNELIEEIEEEWAKNPDERDEELVKEILADMRVNLDKINHHGKRADAIVKGMLAHSRTSNEEKVPTDINALADEYLRLSFHGLRAKDKSFNADFKADFDPNLPEVNVISQDIGRVLLNLINNAFQAVDSQRKNFNSSNPNEDWEKKYQPLVSVSTKNLVNKIEISVSDNGSGIPDEIKDKIFQPFFTTKPSGQGTGLGLSLSYDIIKLHAGEISVNSEVGKGTTFTIHLPL
ncbi:sensor histidine kinase [Fontibacter flavus]|uniref:histidine kinase n=1 Tax=Fontibacter flavus TaxID=654838 RepID=A0ABV6FRD9_9BACT